MQDPARSRSTADTDDATSDRHPTDGDRTTDREPDPGGDPASDAPAGDDPAPEGPAGDDPAAESEVIREPAPDVDPKGRAVVAKRADPGESADTGEIAALAAAAGYAVVGAVSQTRPEDPGTNLGEGKVAELVALAEERSADAAVIDGELTPAQSVELGDRTPEGVAVLDRYRLVLDVFAEGAGTERARLQVEHARLQYELPRIKERTGAHLMSRWTEKGTPVQDVEKRLADIERKLESLPTPAERHRQRRREQGFDLVALAGYTNAGKSTLLHRLADDLSVADREPDHPDRDATAAVQDRLFKTLETTTRKATLGDRGTLVTDTVGFVDDLPHDLVESFSSTLAEVDEADAAVLVADAADPPEELRRNVETALSVVEGADTPVVVALNKVDLLSEEELAARRAAVADLLEEADADGVADPLPVSAIHGAGVEDLRARIREALPTDSVELTLPHTDDAMGLVSWAYDHGEVRRIEYGEAIRVEFAARPGIVEQFRGTAAAIREDGGDGGDGDGPAGEGA